VYQPRAGTVLGAVAENPARFMAAVDERDIRVPSGDPRARGRQHDQGRRADMKSLKLLGAAAAVAMMLDGSGSSEAQEEKPFKFGGVFTLSGPAAFLGLFEEAAARLAVEQFMKGDCIVEAIPKQPCEGGGLKIGNKKIPVEWKAYDDKSESKDAIDDVTRLVEQDGARAVWGPRMNDALLSASRILDPKKIINICSICSSPVMTIGRPLGFDITDTGVIEKHGIGAFINETPEVLQSHGVDPKIFADRKRTAIIARDELYCVHGAIGWDEAMKKGGKYQFDVKKDVVYYPFGTTDFAPFVAKLAALKPDIVLLDVYVIPDMLAITKEMAKQGLDFQTGKVVLLGNDVLGLAYFAGEAKKAGMDMSSGYVFAFSEHDPALAESPAIQKYEKIYNEKYGKTEVGASSPFDRGTYDAAMWFLFAIEAAGTTTDNVKIANAWKTLKLKGLRGPEEEFFVRPDNKQPTGQLFAYEYITTFKEDKSVYTGLAYHDQIFYGPWVYGDKLPKW
jgi:ABC-type branched-subunit amino acid transport system substrate-binding protein